MNERVADELRAWLRAVRRRWQWSAIWRILARSAAGIALLLWVAWLTVRFLPLSGIALVLVATVCVLGSAWFVWMMVKPLRRRPTNLQIARFVEEQCPELDDILVTAAQRLESNTRGGLDRLMFQSALTQVTEIDPDRIVSRGVLRQRAFAALALSAAVIAAIVLLRQPAWRAFQTARMFVAPPTLTWDVTPGDTRIRAGMPLKIVAKLNGLLDGVTPEPATLQVKVGNKQHVVTMTQNGTEYSADLPVDADFQYRVVSGRTASRDYRVDALHPAHVERIDIEYEYPEFTGLKPRKDEDAGDIYGPAGTKVKLHIKTDKPITSGTLAMRTGPAIPLTNASPTETTASMTLDKDGAYRVTMNDVDGLANIDDTEYFIRLMNDRPPDVRILRPSSDRQVTRLEEIAIEARADDDFGVQQLDLVYSVRGGAEHVIPLHKSSVDHDETNVDVTHTLYVEDLDVQPGDFITYYARARDIPRGKRSTESRSDIFFLEVRPYGEEFVAAQSQAAFMNGSSDARDLLQAQKEIIVATWKVERRSQAGQSEQDIRAIARAQGELRKRAEQIAANGGIVINQGQRQHGQGPTEQAAEAGDPIQIAAREMAKAQEQLDGLKTRDAIPHEMTAYNQLLKMQSETKQTAVARQRGGGNSGQTGTQDLSALFDKELMRQSETNYETRNSTIEQKDDQKQDSSLDKLRELARRQDDLARQQQELARQQANMQPEEVKRQLQRLGKEQDDIRRQAESLAQQLAQQQRQAQQGQGQQAQGQQAQGSQSGGQQGQSGQQSAQNQSGQSQGQGQGQGQGEGQSQGAQGQNAQRQNGQGQGQNGQDQNGQPRPGSDALRDAASAMADAAKQLARGDLSGAVDRNERTLQQLRELERQLRGSSPDERKRAMGELQLEAEQMAEAQHRLSADARRLQQQGRSASGSPGDTLRRMAGEQERLAERANALRRGLSDLSTSGKSDQERASLGDAQGELSRQKLEQRMRDAASALRAAGNGTGNNTGNNTSNSAGSNANNAGNNASNSAGSNAGNNGGNKGSTAEGSSPHDIASLANQQDDLARAMDAVAQRMGASVGGNNADSRKLSDQLAQVRAHRNRLNELGQRIDELSKEANGNGSQNGKNANGKSANGQQTQNGQGQNAQGQNGQKGQGQNAQNGQGQAGQSGQSPNGQGQNAQGQSGQSGQAGQGQNAQNGQGQSGQNGQSAGNGNGQGGGDANEMARLQAEYARQLRETQDLLNGLQRDQQGQQQGQQGMGGGPGSGYGSMGGWTPTDPAAGGARNAPGTEAFKQDYAKWDVLRKGVSLALEQAETSLAQRLSEREARDRLNAGGDDRAPAEYSDSVSRYYQALAKRTPKSE